ncbi:pyrroline-5-carboxylate reductase, partial [Salmonella enterica]|nr:pyrroline-5-carboxylate reductase [Salmonella enterica]
MGTVAILGAGVMGETLLSGLVRSGRSADDLVVTTRRPERAADLVERYGVRALSNVE